MDKFVSNISNYIKTVNTLYNESLANNDRILNINYTESQIASIAEKSDSFSALLKEVNSVYGGFGSKDMLSNIFKRIDLYQKNPGDSFEPETISSIIEREYNKESDNIKYLIPLKDACLSEELSNGDYDIIKIKSALDKLDNRDRMVRYYPELDTLDTNDEKWCVSIDDNEVLDLNILLNNELSESVLDYSEFPEKIERVLHQICLFDWKPNGTEEINLEQLAIDIDEDYEEVWQYYRGEDLSEGAQGWHGFRIPYIYKFHNTLTKPPMTIYGGGNSSLMPMSYDTSLGIFTPENLNVELRNIKNIYDNYFSTNNNIDESIKLKMSRALSLIVRAFFSHKVLDQFIYQFIAFEVMIRLNTGRIDFKNHNLPSVINEKYNSDGNWNNTFQVIRQIRNSFVHCNPSDISFILRYLYVLRKETIDLAKANMTL